MGKKKTNYKKRDTDRKGKKEQIKRKEKKHTKKEMYMEAKGGKGGGAKMKEKKK